MTVHGIQDMCLVPVNFWAGHLASIFKSQPVIFKDRETTHAMTGNYSEI